MRLYSGCCGQTLTRKLLLESCNLHTVLDCLGGTFQGAGVKTVVLFFEWGAPTRKVCFWQLNPGRNMGKTNALNDNNLIEFIALQTTFADSPQSWSVDVASLNTTTYDLSVKNPNGGEEVALRTPQDTLDEIAALDAESAEVLATCSLTPLEQQRSGALLNCAKPLRSQRPPIPM